MLLLQRLMLLLQRLVLLLQRLMLLPQRGECLLTLHGGDATQVLTFVQVVVLLL